MHKLAVSVCFIFTLTATRLYAQPLAAHAGNDTVYCGMGNPGDPTLGGIPAATGGNPPYSYEWTILNNNALPDWFLDTLDIPNPRVVGSGVSTMETFRLKITDNSGDTATDDVVVHFSSWTCITADCIKFKFEEDTVSLWPACISNFTPLTYRWSHGQFLSDSNVVNPRCWVPAIATVSVKITNAKGCYMINTCSVHVSTATVPEIGDNSSISISPNPANANSVIHVPAVYLNGVLSIYALDGRVIARKTISAERTALSDVASLPPGILFYRYEKPGLAPATGRLVSSE